MTNYADVNTVADKAAGWTDAQVTCRTMNQHSWPALRHRMTLVSHGPGYYVVQQRCTRGCGVKRSRQVNESGYPLTEWVPDYRDAKGYLMTDDDGKSLGRIDQHGRASLWRTALSGVAVREIPDE